MDPNGNIHRLPTPNPAEDMLRKQMEELEKRVGIERGDLEPIPKAEVPRVRKMNRKARRKWYAKQRKKTRGKTT